MSVPEEVARRVRVRAHGRCQYCLMHESLQGATFHIEHVIPQCEGGRSDLENLALACPGCNLHKAGKIMAIDPATGEHTRLFHPILQLWSEHFRFTASGSAKLRKYLASIRRFIEGGTELLFLAVACGINAAILGWRPGWGGSLELCRC